MSLMGKISILDQRVSIEEPAAAADDIFSHPPLKTIRCSASALPK
jgi:hypothetical protein